MKHSPLSLPTACAHALLLWAAAGIGCKGSAAPNSQNAAPHLEDTTPEGLYSPYYQTGEMNNPRYLHQAIRLKNGLILVSGGTDERGFSSFDTAELFDETSVKKGELRPPSITGQWIDTDFEGNPIIMEFRRFWHTMTLLPDNRVVVIGGSGNWIRARPYERVEVFDPERRIMETLKDAEMITPRVRHTSTFLPDGTIMVAGGQMHDLFIDLFQATVTGGGPGGTVTIQTQTDIFPTVDEVELFSFRDLLFSDLTLPESTKPSKLTSSRGRAGHVAIRFAGFDEILDTGDDLYLLAGGLQTPSTGLLVPTVLAPKQLSTISIRNLEVYDHTLRLFSQIGTAALVNTRVNNPQGTNLGVFNNRTPDSILGMGNVMLVTHGDNDAPCTTSFSADEVFAATFTGFGPAQGLVFTRIQYAAGLENGHLQGMEAAANIGAWEVDPLGGPGRSMTNIVPLPRLLETRPGENGIFTWVFTSSGTHFWCDPPPCVPCTYTDGTIASGALFDPFYRLIPAANFDLTPRPNARDLRATRDVSTNPTGVVGTWLALDGKLPSTDRIGYADVQFSQFGEVWAHQTSIRVYPQQLALAGEDGIYDTVDDRVLITGGGQDGVDLGGEASEPAAELVIIPRSP